MVSLREVAKRATEGRLDAHVRAWVTKIVNRKGRPQKPLAVAKALLEGVREEFTYVFDPTHAEYMVAPGLLARGIFEGGDCDDLAIFLASAILSACSSAGLRCAVVGHGYPEIMHVLVAVHDGDEWYYADPTGKEPFGRYDIAPGHEVVFDVPVKEGEEPEPFCDAELCLRGPFAVPPPELRHDGTFIGVGGRPRSSATDLWESLGGCITIPEDEETLSSSVGILPSLGGDLPQGGAASRDSLLADLAPSVAERIAQTKEEIDDALVRVTQAHAAMKRTAETLGVELPMMGPPAPGYDPHQWTVREEQAYENLVFVLGRVSSILAEALSGERRVGFTENDDVAVEMLPSDQYSFRERASDALSSWWSVVPEAVSRKLPTAGAAPAAAVAPVVWVAAGVIAAGVIAVAIAVATQSGAIARAAEYIMQKFTQYLLVREQRILIEKGASPEEARRAVKASEDAVVETDKSIVPVRKASPDSTPFVVLAGAAGLVLGAWGMHRMMKAS